MAKAVKPIPEGRQLTPYLMVRGAAKAIKFYKTVFGARELVRIGAPGGKIGHAELVIGGASFSLADEAKEWGALSPKTVGGTPVQLALYVRDVDAVVKKAVKAGAKVVRRVETQFYGDRAGQIRDPFGHVWHLASRVEAVSFAEMKRRARKLYGV